MISPKNPVHTEQIVKDITGSTLCSYQIAQKYKITKMTVDRIAKNPSWRQSVSEEGGNGP